MNRRDFFHSSTGLLLGAGALDIFAPKGARAQGQKTRVVLVRHPRLLATPLERRRPMYQALLTRGMERLFGGSATKAWGQLFSARDVVGIKVNCQAARISTNVELSLAIADALRSAQLPPENVIIFDRKNRELEHAGYTVTPPSRMGGVKVYGTDADGVGYEERLTQRGSIGSRLSHIVTEQCTALINAPILKDHAIAGITASLKNYFGVINNPNKFHSNSCDPYVADLNTLPVLREKQRLIVCDCTEILYHGGPADSPNHRYPCGGILLGTDPLAVDTVGWQLIEGIRREKGLPSLAEAKNPPRHLFTAGRSPYLLGVGEFERIELVQEILTA